MDIVDKQTRSRMMAGIRAVNTKPETFIRSSLHKMGFRFRIHVKNMPGKPDVVLPRYQAVVLVHGCFWHGHECNIFKWPSTRREFWRKKINDTRKRDSVNFAKLHDSGWRVAVIWECEIRGEIKHGERFMNRLAKWLKGMKSANFNETTNQFNREG